MGTRSIDHSALAWAFLTLFPHLFVSRYLRSNFRSKYGLAVDAQVALGTAECRLRDQSFSTASEKSCGYERPAGCEGYRREEWVVELVENDSIPRSH